MDMYKICFITFLITIAFAIIIGVALQEYKETIICHTEYQEPLTVITNVSSIEYFHLHTFLSTLVVLP